MVRTILIVDDVKRNREVLKHILGGEYAFVEAESGQEALNILNQIQQRISAVLLDLSMSGMDAFEFLLRMQRSETMRSIPVIATAGQADAGSCEKALQFGAKDYLSRPYRPFIVRQRLQNIVYLQETAAKIQSLQRDPLTGLYNRELFFKKVEELVHTQAPGYYIMACFDIDNFKVINDQYGTKKGDEVLKYIADVFRTGFKPHGGLCCRVAADNYAVLYPAEFSESDEIVEIREKAGSVEGLISTLTFSIGRYLVEDLSLTPAAMYDRAALAEVSVKGRYDTQIAYYHESMRNQLLSRQEVVSEMIEALKARQFEVWFQPQFNHSTGARIGAEALVRWHHPRKGIVSPASFIPIFERNGFIYELDQYVWEETCRFLSQWIEEGKTPLPVSVNVSRYDIFRSDLVPVLTGLLKKYALPVELLCLEITESAFARSTKQIVSVVRELIEQGFTIEIDDFGSGYSSLNTLKSVPAQVLKLDMRFLTDDENSGRGGNILESVVRMAKWLGMSVIAEGVEKKEQADFLKSIGCSYVQGYLYARPMPVSEYEEYCRKIHGEGRLLSLETIEHLDNNTFWDPSSMDTLIFNSYIGCACIFEYHTGTIELLRATEKYAQMMGNNGMSIEEALKLDWTEHLDETNRRRVDEALKQSIETKKEVTDEYVFLDLPGCPRKTYLRTTLRVIASTGDRHLVYCTNENITAQRQAEYSERKVARQLKAFMDNMNCGITPEAVSIQEMLPIALTAVLAASNELSFVKDRNLRYICCSRAFAHMVGLEDETDIAGKSDYDLFERALADQYVSDDRKLMESRESIVDMIENLPAEDGRARYSSTSKYLLYDSAGNVVGLYGTGRDVTEAREMKSRLELVMNNIPGGIAIYEGSPNRLDQIRLTYFSDGFCKMFGYSRQEYEKRAQKNPLGLVFAQDIAGMMGQIRELVWNNKPMDLVYRVKVKDGSFKWINLKAVMGEPHGSEMSVNAVFFDVTERQEAIQRLRMSEEESRLAITHSQNVVCKYNVKDYTLTVSAAANPIFEAGGVLTEVPWGQVRRNMVSPDTADAYIAFYERILHGEKDGTIVYQRKSSIGWRWLEARFTTIFSDDNEPVSAVISFIDVTERLEKDAAYEKWQQSLKNKKPESYALYRCNVSKQMLFDRAEGELLAGCSRMKERDFEKRVAEYAVRYVFEDDAEHFIRFLKSDTLLANYYQGKRSVTMEYREKCESGEFRWLQLTADLVEFPHSADVEAYLLFEDINEAKRKELATIERAETDSLTGVMNRATFEVKANELIRESKPGRKHALLMLDLDRFKQVNDTFGHGMGDRLLIEIAGSLRLALRHGDLVGRLGGDEFIVFLRDIPGEDIAAEKANQICTLTRRSFSGAIEISGSVGISMAPKDGTDFGTLYRKADSALYYVKNTGKDNYAFYQNGMTAGRQR